jgi:hypothetical protein
MATLPTGKVSERSSCTSPSQIAAAIKAVDLSPSPYDLHDNGCRQIVAGCPRTGTWSRRRAVTLHVLGETMDSGGIANGGRGARRRRGDVAVAPNIVPVEPFLLIAIAKIAFRSSTAVCPTRSTRSRLDVAMPLGADLGSCRSTSWRRKHCVTGGTR